MRFYLLIIFLAAVISFFACMAVYILAKKYSLYKPVRSRDMHVVPVPRLGGIGILISFCLSLLIASNIVWFGEVFEKSARILTVLICALIITSLGIIDDFVDLPWTVKLFVQFAVAFLLTFFGFSLNFAPFENAALNLYFSHIITALLTVMVMNAMNFIDGLDGLVAGITIISGGIFLVYSYLITEQQGSSRFSIAALICSICLGACGGFLPFNWRPAKMFMGDGGSLFLGFAMAVSSIAIAEDVAKNASSAAPAASFPAYLPLIFPFAVLFIPALDFSFCVIRRIIKLKSPFYPDDGHIHHRLLKMGHKHIVAVFILYAWAFYVGLFALLVFLVDNYWIWIAFALVGVVLCSFATFGTRLQLFSRFKLCKKR